MDFRCEVNLDAMEKAFKNATNLKEWQKVGRKIYKTWTDSVKGEVMYKASLLYPGGKRKDSGMWRGKQYGRLWLDVRGIVYKSGQGGVVTLYPNRKKKNTRASILVWLNEGVEEERKVNVKRTRASKNPIKDKNGSSVASRGVLLAENFFTSSVDAVEYKAQLMAEQKYADQAKRWFMNEL